MKTEKTVRIKKEKPTFYKVLGIIADIIMYPILIISLLSSFSMLIFNRGNSLPSFFGVSVAKILSGSMESSGYKRGDIVLVAELNTDKIRVGDDIAFYRFNDSSDPSRSDLVLIEDFKNLPEVTTNEKVIGSKTKADAKKAKSAIIFHRVIAVYMAEDGTRFYETKGTSNNSPDGQLTREDFVVGRYVNTPRFFRNFCSFCASSTGMIVLVVLPLSILILLECLSVIEQINNMILENKVFMREEPYDSKDSLRAKIMIEMEPYRKVYFYITTHPNERERVAAHLWDYLYESKNKKDLEMRKMVEESLVVAMISEEKFFNYWLDNFKGYQKRHLATLKKEYDYKKLLIKNLKERNS